VTIFIGILAALMSTIIFFIDLGLVLTVRNKVKNATNGDLQLNWGNAVCLLHQGIASVSNVQQVWMVFGASIAIGSAICIVASFRNRYLSPFVRRLSLKLMFRPVCLLSHSSIRSGSKIATN
jgi:hypothetical protein